MQNCSYTWDPKRCRYREANAGYADADAEQREDKENQDGAEKAFYKIIPDAVEVSRHALADKARVRLGFKMCP